MISGYINSVPFSVYNCGEFVLSPSEHYIRWTPSDISDGTFTIAGSTYNFSDYSGYFTWYGSTITSSAFQNNSLLTSIETDAVRIEDSAFYNCNNILYISIPNCKYIGSYAFYNNNIRASGTFLLSKCEYIGSYAFYSNHWLGTSGMELPKCSYIGGNAFNSCMMMSNVYLSVCSYIGERAFNQARPRLLKLWYSSVCYIPSSTVFNDSDTYWSVYVPSSLYYDYIEARGWSYFYGVNQIVSF